MKLAVLGVVAVAVGAVLAIPGLMGIGAVWVGIGALVRAHAQKLKGLKAAAAEADGADGDGAKPKPAIDGRTFAIGSLLWLVLGVPSLLVGILEVGIPAEHTDWRWLPIAVGGYALAIGGISAILYLTGTAISAAPPGAKPEVPATLTIRAVRETGTFINERPRLEFEFSVEPDPASGVVAYQVTKKATVPFTAIGSVRVGDGFRALVAGPDSPTSMEIHWDQPVAREPAAGAARADTREPADVSSRLEELEQLRREAKISDAEYEAQRGRILGSL